VDRRLALVPNGAPDVDLRAPVDEDRAVDRKDLVGIVPGKLAVDGLAGVGAPWGEVDDALIVVLERELVRVGIAGRTDGAVEGERRVGRLTSLGGAAGVVGPGTGVEVPVVPLDCRGRDRGRRGVEDGRPDVVANGRRPGGTVDARIVRCLSLVAATLADVCLIDVRTRSTDVVVGGLLIQRALDDHGALSDRCGVLKTQI